jgi:hypothetical protein
MFLEHSNCGDPGDERENGLKERHDSRLFIGLDL